MGLSYTAKWCHKDTLKELEEEFVESLILYLMKYCAFEVYLKEHDETAELDLEKK